MRSAACLLALAALLVLGAAPAEAARTCESPAGAWERATPAEAGMDASKLQAAVTYATTQVSFAVRVYRHGCLVAEDGLAPVNRTSKFESWSMAKSMVALAFGRAMTLGLISPDDPVGSLLPEADRAHGAITARDLLTMTSGLRWDGLRDYDIAMPDRLRDALTVGIAHPPGTYFEYSQSGPALLTEMIQRAVGEDFQAFAQKELFGPIGIGAGSWYWRRDLAGHTQGFFGLNMTPDDFGRLGELMREHGVWRGRRLLSQAFVRDALTPTPTNGCYGWLIWLNAGRPCVSPRTTSRPVQQSQEFPDLPSDLFRYSGLFGQLVAVFPTQDVMIVRNGQQSLPGLTGPGGFEDQFYRRVLGAITDEPVALGAPATDAAAVDSTGGDAGFQSALLEPLDVLAPLTIPALPAAGPARARAARLRLAATRVSRTGRVSVRLTCPSRWPGAVTSCAGAATLDGARHSAAYRVAPGATRLLRFTLGSAALRALRAQRHRTLTVTAVDADAAAGTSTHVDVTVTRPRR